MPPSWCLGDILGPLIVKLGGSVITDKHTPFRVRRKVVKRLAHELKSARGPLVLIHGGGSFGHPLASKYGIANGYRSKTQLMGLSLTHGAMEQLNVEVVGALQKAGLPAMGVQPSSCVVVDGGRIRHMELVPVRKLLELGMVPVLYGDAVPDISQGMSILSGDQIASYLARELRASRVIMGVDVDGVYRKGRKSSKRVEIIRRITPDDEKLLSSLGTAGKGDVTGGMRNKVRELLEAAKEGIEAEIVNASKPGVLERAIRGERGLGTVVSGRR